MADDFTPWERETLELFLILGHEVQATAVALRADYASAHLRLGANEMVVFTYDAGRVSVTGLGFDVELTRLREW
jgi:hypothetical protein